MVNYPLNCNSRCLSRTRGNKIWIRTLNPRPPFPSGHHERPSLSSCSHSNKRDAMQIRQAGIFPYVALSLPPSVPMRSLPLWSAVDINIKHVRQLGTVLHTSKKHVHCIVHRSVLAASRPHKLCKTSVCCS